MSYIETDNYGYSEREIEQNWAAEYAKVVTNELEEKHDEDIQRIDASLEALSEKFSESITKTELDDAVDAIEQQLDVYEAQLTDAQTRLDNCCEYSTTPVQVGKWTDGTPIWRAAFEVEYSDLAESSDITCDDIGLNLAKDAVILNAGCTVIVANAPGKGGDVVPEYDQRNVDSGYLFYVDGLNSYIRTTLSTYGGTFYGYVEYFNPQSAS